MPRTKKEVTEKKVREPRVNKVEEELKVEETLPSSEEEEKVVLPEYDGSRVRYIMQDDRSNETHYHCKMEDNTTKHVPKELFNEE